MRPSTLVSSFAALILASTNIAAQDPVQLPPPVTHDLEVSRYYTTDLAQDRIDDILGSMGGLLATMDGSNDVPCNVSFARNGTVSTFMTGDGAVDTASKLTAVLELPGRVKIVNSIRWCRSFEPNAIGCARRPGNTLVVVPLDEQEKEPILWAHEFGHNKGLRHRTGANLLMNGRMNPDMKQINLSECNSFRQP